MRAKATDSRGTAALHKRADIQGLRAIAIAAVLANYANIGIGGGFAGVDMFFAISGFVVASMLLREHAKKGRIAVRDFYWRRLRRLGPALSLMLTITLLAAGLLLSPYGQQQTAAAAAVAAALLGANVYFGIDLVQYENSGQYTNLYLNTWSLSVEEQFYIATGVALLLTGVISHPRTRRRLLLASLTCAGGASLAWALASSAGLIQFGWLTGFYSPFSRAWEFIAGALLAVALSANTHKRLSSQSGARSNSERYTGTALALLGAAMLAAVLLVDPPAQPWPTAATLLPVAGTCALLLSGTLNPENPIATALGRRTLVAIGDRSYSLYLWSWPVLVFAATLGLESPAERVGALVLAGVIACAAYAKVENPLRYITIAGAVRKSLFGALIAAPPLIVAALLYTGAQHYWGADPSQGRLFGTSGPGTNACQRYATGTPTSPITDPQCASGSTTSNQVIYLLGDSQAGQWFEAVGAAGTVLGKKAITAASPLCPFIDAYVGNLDQPQELPRLDACRRTYETYIEYLKNAPPGDIILSQTLGYVTGDELFLDSTPNLRPRTPEEKLDTLQSSIQRTVGDLKAAGHRVYFVLPVALLDRTGESAANYACPTWRLLFTHECGLTGRTYNYAGATVQERHQATQLLTSVGVPVLDPLGIQCPDGTCPYFIDGVPVLIPDGAHVSSELSAKQALAFVDLLS